MARCVSKFLVLISSLTINANHGFLKWTNHQAFQLIHPWTIKLRKLSWEMPLIYWMYQVIRELNASRCKKRLWKKESEQEKQVKLLLKIERSYELRRSKNAVSLKKAEKEVTSWFFLTKKTLRLISNMNNFFQKQTNSGMISPQAIKTKNPKMKLPKQSKVVQMERMGNSRDSLKRTL